jgi:hypothetical protein
MLAAMPMFPELPDDIPAEQRAHGQGSLRYEDVAQDGRLVLTALPQFLGLLVFQQIFARDQAARSLARSGIFPIMSRMIIEGGHGPVSVSRRVDGSGGFALAHTVDDSGAPNRLLLEMWAAMTAPRARTHGPPPPGAGEAIGVGRVYGEHVFTRLFATPAERRVTRFPSGPWPEVPPARREWRDPEAILALPAGAEWLEDERADESPIVFGLVHSDSNQHVNSLVYPRLFEDAALRRLGRLGRSTLVLARFVEVGYRKPCFAGQSVRIVLRAYARGDRLGMVGWFRAEDDAAARPNAVVKMELG